MAQPKEPSDAKPFKMPPARSGPKSLVVIVALLLVFLGTLWYLSFAALHARGPDRVFFLEESWGNETVAIYVSDLDLQGQVPLSTLTATIVAQGGERLYAGALGQNRTLGNLTVRVDWIDVDGSGTVTGRDGLNVTVAPRGSDNLILATLYLYSNGQEWGAYRFE